MSSGGKRSAGNFHRRRDQGARTAAWIDCISAAQELNKIANTISIGINIFWITSVSGTEVVTAVRIFHIVWNSVVVLVDQRERLTVRDRNLIRRLPKPIPVSAKSGDIQRYRAVARGKSDAKDSVLAIKNLLRQDRSVLIGRIDPDPKFHFNRYTAQLILGAQVELSFGHKGR